MKVIILFFSLFICANQPVDKIEIPRYLKVEKTFSGYSNDDSTFHLIVAKNLKDNEYNILTYIDTYGLIEEMPVVSFKNKVEIISFHNRDDIITLIVKTKGKSKTNFEIIDIDTLTEEVKYSNYVYAIEDFKTVIRGKDSNVLLYGTDEEISLVVIKNTTDIVETFSITNDSNRDFIESLATSNLDAVQEDEYFENGSISQYKAYLKTNKLVITRDQKGDGIVKTLVFSTFKEKQQFLYPFEYKIEESVGLKKNNSFLKDDKLFQIKLNKTEIYLNIFDFDNGIGKGIDLLESSSVFLNSKKDSILNYCKIAAKNGNEPTILINSTANNNYKVRLGFAKKDDYYFNQNWWWHHDWMNQNNFLHQQMIKAQDAQMRRDLTRRRFGPNANQDFLFVNTLNSTKKNKIVSFDFIISPNGDIIDSDLVLFDNRSNRSEVIQSLDKDKNLRRVSTVFLKDSYKHFAFHKESKSYKIVEVLF